MQLVAVLDHSVDQCETRDCVHSAPAMTRALSALDVKQSSDMGRQILPYSLFETSQVLRGAPENAQQRHHRSDKPNSFRNRHRLQLTRSQHPPAQDCRPGLVALLPSAERSERGRATSPRPFSSPIVATTGHRTAFADHDFISRR